MQNEEQLRQFMAQHGEGIFDRQGIEIDRIESQVKVCESFLFIYLLLFTGN